MHDPKDHRGVAVVSGARVRLLLAPAELLSGLPTADQAAVVGAVGSVVTVDGFDAYGHAELMFKDASGHIHFIWVRPSALEVIQ